jgi:hypothetical protein
MVSGARVGGRSRPAEARYFEFEVLHCDRKPNLGGHRRKHHATFDHDLRKTGRILAVDEAYLTCGIQGEVIALVTERAFKALKAAPRRLGNPGVPVPFAPPLEDAVLPDQERIMSAIREML